MIFWSFFDVHSIHFLPKFGLEEVVSPRVPFCSDDHHHHHHHCSPPRAPRVRPLERKGKEGGDECGGQGAGGGGEVEGRGKPGGGLFARAKSSGGVSQTESLKTSPLKIRK